MPAVEDFIESFDQLRGIRWVVLTDRQGLVIASALHREARPPHPSLMCWPLQATGLGKWIASALQNRNNPDFLKRIRRQVFELAEMYPLYAERRAKHEAASVSR